MWLIFRIKLLIYPSKGDLDEKILFGKISYHLGPEIRKLLRFRGFYGKEDSIFSFWSVICLPFKCRFNTVLCFKIKFRFQWQLNH